MMRKKNIKPKYVILLIIVLVLIILVIFSYTLKPDRKLNKVEAFIKDVVTSGEKIIFYPFRLVINKVDDYRELKEIREKYQHLLPEVERIDALNAENIELRKELKAMKEELGIEHTLSDYEYLNATVISRNITNWYNMITIDKGSYNGLKSDMVVVNASGLIGKVIRTTTFTSDVRLITSSDTINKISITISDGKKSINGLINGYNINTGYLEVEGISNTIRVNEGEYVYTSGLGGIFPSGIMIGTVKNITTDEYDLTKVIDVVPRANFDDLNYVAILKRKEISK